MSLAFLVALVLAVALGEAATSGATVQVKNDSKYGSYLADAHGMALYALSADSKNTSTCTGACAKAWPPLTTQGAPTAGSGVAGSLLGTIKRPDGSMQVTYNGIPLYTFVKDTKAGDVNGEGIKAFGGTWTLVSPYGVTVKPPAAAAPAKPAASQPSASNVSGMELASLRGVGQPVFAHICFACHGSNGQGGRGPKFVGNSRILTNTELVVRHIYYGGHFMPPFGKALTQQQIAGVATYIRTSWGNKFGAVTEQEVKKILANSK